MSYYVQITEKALARDTCHGNVHTVLMETEHAQARGWGSEVRGKLPRSAPRCTFHVHLGGLNDLIPHIPEVKRGRYA